jgi:beta-glucosidase
MAGVAVAAEKQEILPYKNPKLSVEERLKDLISRMTLEEKVGQLRCTLAWNYYEIRGARSGERGRGNAKLEVVPSESFKKDIAEGQIGMLWATYRADPWTQKSLSNGLNPELAARCGNALQRYVMENTRLGIPLFLAEEAPHGHMAIGTTVFPTGFGMAATWSPELIERAGEVIAKEIRLQGGHISYGPVIDLAREPRWSRVEETFGEDPVLAGSLGAAMVSGLGGGDLSKPYSTLATLKHFIGYGTTEGGQNGGPTIAGARDLKENFLPPFRQAINAGALSVMTSYNSLDGVPSTGSRALLTDLLRNEWGFRGFVVSDLYSIDGMWHTHHIVNDANEAGIMALKAGVDADLGANAFKDLAEDVRQGLVDEADIDRAVERVLRMKFEMGLFDNPYVDPKAARAVRSEENKQVALDVARAAVTLLKNETPSGAVGGAHILPLSKDLRVLVCGPNADNRYNMLGDYTAPQEDSNVKTVLNGIRQKLPASQVDYVKGCAVRDMDNSNIPEAVEAARKADVVVCVVGGSSARDFKTSYKATGAAEINAQSVSDMDCGEGYDRATLQPLGRQMELLSELKKTGKPLVVVYIEGRPMDKTWAAENADALLTAYYPGQEGGTAIADVLFGDYNPAGRLPVTVPRSVGQLPVYYNKKAPAAHDYMDLSAKPLYAFGYGLSYTTFEYDNVSLEETGDTQFEITFDVTNTGQRDGEEVVQLYLHDEVASVVQPLKQLKKFQRVFIPKGETRQVKFTLDAEDLSIINAEMESVVEPGDFTVMIGSSSDDIRLKLTLTQN